MVSSNQADLRVFNGKGNAERFGAGLLCFQTGHNPERPRWPSFHWLAYLTQHRIIPIKPESPSRDELLLSKLLHGAE